MANTTQYAQALENLASTVANQKAVVTDPLRQPTTFQQMMAANDPYIANGLGFAEMLTNPFIANKQRANMELQQSMANKLKADELKAKAAADLDEHERYLKEEARKDKQMKLDMLRYQEPVPGMNFDTVDYELLRAYDPEAAKLMDKLSKSTVADRSNPSAYAEFEQQRKADLGQLQRYMERFKKQGIKWKTKPLSNKTPPASSEWYDLEKHRLEEILGGDKMNFTDTLRDLIMRPFFSSDKKNAYMIKQMQKNRKAISDWRDSEEGRMFDSLKPVDVTSEIQYLIDNGANSAAGALQDTADSIKKAGGLLLEGTHSIGGNKEYFAVVNGNIQLIDPLSAIIKADNNLLDIGLANQAQSRINE